MMDALEMETLSFRVEGIAQALYAICQSTQASEVGWALDILAREAKGVSKDLKEAGEAMLKPSPAS